jgi:hypothetical protein
VGRSSDVVWPTTTICRPPAAPVSVPDSEPSDPELEPAAVLEPSDPLESTPLVVPVAVVVSLSLDDPVVALALPLVDADIDAPSLPGPPVVSLPPPETPSPPPEQAVASARTIPGVFRMAVGRTWPSSITVATT